MAQAEVQTPPAHVVEPETLVDEHRRPHAPQAVAVEAVSVSQPSRSGAVAPQFLKAPLQAVYVQLVPAAQAAPVLCVVSQASPQPVQLLAVLSGVSQPARSGAVAVQLPKPALHPEYVHVVPVLHEAPVLFVVSQTRPQPVHEVVEVVGDSQPLELMPVVSQSTKPAEQPV